MSPPLEERRFPKPGLIDTPRYCCIKTKSSLWKVADVQGMRRVNVELKAPPPSATSRSHNISGWGIEIKEIIDN